ncbi:MAG: hypothetical protein Q8L72_11880 [Moraxellaceae bacterium]|nr:hypothetical protein [Moraxellaceae bacterium]
MSAQKVDAQQGFGMAEALIALLLATFILTGLLALHWQLYARHAQAYQRFVVNFAVADLLQRWRLNMSADSDYRAHLQQPLSPQNIDSCRLQSCSAGARARADVIDFELALHELIHAQWQLKPCPHAPGDCLWVAWHGQLLDQCLAKLVVSQSCLVVNTP